MADLKPYTVETEEGREFNVALSEKENASWLVRIRHEKHHIDTKKNVNAFIKKLGYTPK